MGVPGPQVQYLEGPRHEQRVVPAAAGRPSGPGRQPDQPQPQSQNANVAQNLSFIPQEITVSAVTPTAVPMGARTRIIRVNGTSRTCPSPPGPTALHLLIRQQGRQYHGSRSTWLAELDAIGKLWH